MIRDLLRNPFFGMACLCLSIMMLVVLLGDPRVGYFYYHFIPEMFGIYFLGITMASLKLSVKHVFVIYFIVSMLNSNLNFIRLIVGLILGWPLLLGYWVYGKVEKNG